MFFGKYRIELVAVPFAFLRLKINILPLQEVFGFEMSIARGEVAIYFQKAEMGGIGGILKDIETDHPRLQHGFTRVLEGGGFICFDLIGSNVMVDLKDIHGCLLCLNRA
jgi:hypothetical protein